MEKTPPQEKYILLDIEHLKLYLCVYDVIQYLYIKNKVIWSLHEKVTAVWKVQKTDIFLNTQWERKQE